MIRQLTTPDDILLLADLPDGAPEFFGCDRGGWIQFLMTWAVVANPADEPRVRIWAGFDGDNRVIGYVSAADNRIPPIRSTVLLIHAWVTADNDCFGELLERVVEWAGELPASIVEFKTALPFQLLERHGFRRAADNYERELD